MHTNAINELRALAREGAISLVESEVTIDLDNIADGEAAYASFTDVATIRGIVAKLDRVPSAGPLSVEVTTSPFCGKAYATVFEHEREDSRIYASGNVDYVAGFIDAMRVAFTRISRAWYARGLM